MANFKEMSNLELNHYFYKGLQSPIKHGGNTFKIEGSHLFINDNKYKWEEVPRKEKIKIVKNLGLKEKVQKKVKEAEKRREKALRKIEKELDNLSDEKVEKTLLTEKFEKRTTRGRYGRKESISAVFVPCNDITEKGHGTKEGMHGWIEKILYNMNLKEVEMMNVTMCPETKLYRRIMDLAVALQNKHEKKVTVKVKGVKERKQWVQERYVPKSLKIEEVK